MIDTLSLFEKIAPFLTQPLVLVGFVLMLAYSIHRQLLKMDIFPKLNQEQGGRIIALVLQYGFCIVMLVIFFVFTRGIYEAKKQMAAPIQSGQNPKDEQFSSSAPDANFSDSVRFSSVVPTGDKKPGYCYNERGRLQSVERFICDSKALSSLDVATYDAYVAKRDALQGDLKSSFVKWHESWVKMWHKETRNLDGQALTDYLEGQFQRHIQEIQRQ